MTRAVVLVFVLVVQGTTGDWHLKSPQDKERREREVAVIISDEGHTNDG